MTRADPAEGTAPTRVHIVPHTHWDREWYEPFQTFRMRLVHLVDGVLDLLDAHPEFAFTLDGQLATVDDYLEIRPEQEERVRAHVRSGRLCVGPWQILMDEFLSSGETMVRNLQKGWRRAEELGGVMAVGYLPDMFGHVAQMPQLLRRAGIQHAVLWRGVPAAIDRHVFTWEALDGSAVRTEYLFGGYGNAAYLLALPEALARTVEAFAMMQRPYFGDDDLLAMMGTDHATPVPDAVRLVRDLNAAQQEYRAELTTLDRYIAETAPRLATQRRWRGEMRSGSRANVLAGVTSVRTDSKAAGGRAERALERYAEPLAALHGDQWPATLLDLAWERVIDNSAHDSICSCSLDEVVGQVKVRYAEAEQIGRGIVGRVAEHVGTRAPRGSFVVLNPSPDARSGLVRLDVAGQAGAVRTPDGRVFPTQVEERVESILLCQRVAAERALDVFDLMHGRELFGRQLNRCVAEQTAAGPRLTFEVDVDPDPPTLDIAKVRAEVETGVRAVQGVPWQEQQWELRIVGRARRTLEAMVDVPALGGITLTPVSERGAVDHPVRADDGVLDNGLLRLVVAVDGTVAVQRDGVTLTGVGRLVDGGDAGDSYNYAPPLDDRLIDEPSSVQVKVLAEGPVRGCIVVVRTYDWPASSEAAGRAAEIRPVQIETVYELRAGEPFVRVTVSFDNSCADHRLRFHVPLPARVDRSFAEGQFGVAERGLEVEGGHGEYPLPTFPASGFVAVDGIAVLLDHVTEYEVVDGGAELAVTVLRATGMISRNLNAYRREPAGPEIAIPAAQCKGTCELRFALLPVTGPWHRAGILAQMERYRHPLVVAPGTGAAQGDMPAGLSVEGDGVVLSALLLRDGWLEARVVNLQPEPATCALRGGVLAARGTDLHGNPGQPIEVAGGALTLDLSPWEIRTVQFTRAGE